MTFLFSTKSMILLAEIEKKEEIVKNQTSEISIVEILYCSDRNFTKNEIHYADTNLIYNDYRKLVEDIFGKFR